MHGQSGIHVHLSHENVGAVGPEVGQLLIRHVVHLLELVVCIGCNELLDDHETASHSDDELAVEDLGVDLLGSEPVLATTDLPERHRAVHSVDVLAQHLIEDVASWGGEDWSPLLIPDSAVHDLDYLVLILQEVLDGLDGNALSLDSHFKFSEGHAALLLVFLQSLDVRVKPLYVALQVPDLRSLNLDLLVQVHLLQSNDVELSNLVLNDVVPLLQSVIDLLDLSSDGVDLVLDIGQHLITATNLLLQMLHQVVLLVKLVAHLDQLLPLLQELGLVVSSDL